MSDDLRTGTFLGRWARRKEAARAAERTERPPAALPPAETTEGDTEVDAPALPEAALVPPEDVPADAMELPELPSLDALTAQTDLTPFLRAGVPAALRNAALRRMWSIDPAIRDFVSEAREYAYDWNTPGGVPGLGPLLPGDDVAAMLRRIIGAPPAPAALDSPVEDEPAPPPGGAPIAQEPALAAPSVIDGNNAIARSEATNPPCDEAVSTEDPQPVNEKNETPAPRSHRLRRHGGAMPV